MLTYAGIHQSARLSASMYAVAPQCLPACSAHIQLHLSFLCVPLRQVMQGTIRTPHNPSTYVTQQKVCDTAKHICQCSSASDTVCLS